MKSSKIKSMFPEATNKHRTDDSSLESTSNAEDLSHFQEQVPDTIVERLKHSNYVETTSLSSFKSGQSEKQPDTSSISSGDRFFSLPESQSETSSMADSAMGSAAHPNTVLILEEENEKEESFHKVDEYVVPKKDETVSNDSTAVNSVEQGESSSER